MRNLFPLIAMAFLTACGTAKVLTASEDGIAIDVAGTEWTASEMLRKAADIAKEHCAKYGKQANLEGTSGFLGAANTVRFTCK